MRKTSFFTVLFSGLIFFSSAQSVTLSGIYDSWNAMITLNWNMVNSPVRSGYILLRSNDGISWTEAMKDKILRNYTDEDIYTFNDKNFFAGSNYYRIRIYDIDNNTIALSSIIKINTAFINTTTTQRPVSIPQQNTVQNKIETQQYNTDDDKKNWVIYPNPATDFLYLNYKGSESLKGIVNVTVIDGSGKTVIKFRSGSMYNKIQVPLTYLQRGAYFVQVTVMDKLMMNQRFIKQ